MKKMITIVTLALLLVANSLNADENSVVFPSNPPADSKKCTANLKRWLPPNTSVTKGVRFLPANSLTFSDATNCNFYQWSWQNFLWLTSPTGADGGLVLNSKPFYDLDLSTGTLSNDAALATRVEKNDSVTEATGNALVWGNQNSLVYFGIHTNDVWAYFEQLNTQGKLSPAATDFPTDQASLQAIITGAMKVYGASIKDGQTLAMEIKTAWVDASLVPNKSAYITIQSNIPEYDKSNKSKWTLTGNQKKVELALVGIHIVGSVKGHKEMVWATFEHQNNAPNGNFHYTAADGKNYKYSNFTNGVTTNDWLFMPKGTKMNSVPMNKGNIAANNVVKGTDITSATSGQPIVGQNIYRQSPWGTFKAQANPKAENNNANNTDIISINQNVLKQLADGDVRSNYFLVGATWANNIVPDQDFYPSALPTNGSIIKGSQTLSNTTMETFIQTQNCFLCHSGKDPLGQDQLSHIYGKVKKFNK